VVLQERLREERETLTRRRPDRVGSDAERGIGTEKWNSSRVSAAPTVLRKFVIVESRRLRAGLSCVAPTVLFAS